MRADEKNLGFLSVVRVKDGSHVCVTPKGNHVTVPPGVIPPSAAYVDRMAAPA